MPKNKLNNADQQLNLFNISLENLQEAVFWLGSRGQILYANIACRPLFGYAMEELLGMHFAELSPVEMPLDFPLFWQRVKNNKKVVVEGYYRHKTGDPLYIETCSNYVEQNGQEYLSIILRDIRKKKFEEELLMSISENTSGVTGVDYFRNLTKCITAVLNVRFSMVVSCSADETTQLCTLAYADGAEIIENKKYYPKGTPCEIVMQGKDFFCADNLDETFPREKGIKSWVAVPIYSPSSGKVIGNVAAFDRAPMTNDKNQSAVLKIFAARAGSEMERINAQEKLMQSLKTANSELQEQLKQSEERFRDLFEEAPIAYVNEGLDSKFIRANRAALRILGVTPEQVPYTYGKLMAPNTPDAQRRMREAFESVGRGTDTSGVVLELRRKDNGKPIWIQWWSNPDPSGTFTRTMFLDITEQVLLEQEQAKLKAQNQYLQEEIKLTHNFDEIISKSANFRKVLIKIEQVASTDSTVLILGESGTGKELIARALHNISKRSKRPLVKVNCATLPANLIESELFGHERGAFTGALDRKIGRFELGDGGTIFLDEIGELPYDLQSKLLRVLQEGEFERLGNPRTVKVDVRIIAATNRNLELAIEKKEFRADLYYRLNVFPICCPPLRERKEDIPLLVKHFCQKYEAKIGKKISSIPKPVMDALAAYNWPGNIRELENIIERALILNQGDVLEYGEWVPSCKTDFSENTSLQTMEDVEKAHITAALKKTGWKVSGEKGAAKVLGLNATTLEARMKKLGIKRE